MYEEGKQGQCLFHRIIPPILTGWGYFSPGHGVRLTLIRSLAVTLVAGDVIWLEVSIDGVIIEGAHHFLKGIRDEDEGDEAGEALLCEARHVLDDVAGVCGHQDQALEAGVQANPEPDLHVVDVIVSEHRRQFG